MEPVIIISKEDGKIGLQTKCGLQEAIFLLEKAKFILMQQDSQPQEQKKMILPPVALRPGIPR